MTFKNATEFHIYPEIFFLRRPIFIFGNINNTAPLSKKKQIYLATLELQSAKNESTGKRKGEAWIFDRQLISFADCISVTETLHASPFNHMYR